MVPKLVYVDGEKWVKFKKWCVNNDTTIKAEIDKFLNQVIGGKNE